MTDQFDNTRAQDQLSKQFLTFSVNNEEYGVDIMTVREIKGWTETTRLPNSAASMRGVMNLRGLVIPIFDLRARFTRVMTDVNEKHVVIILAVEDRTIGILVDAVSDILSVSDSDIKPTPKLESGANTDFISGLISLQGRMVVLLSVGALFNSELDILPQPQKHVA